LSSNLVRSIDILRSVVYVRCDNLT